MYFVGLDALVPMTLGYGWHKNFAKSHFVSGVADNNNSHSLNGYNVEGFLVLHKHYLI